MGPYGPGAGPGPLGLLVGPGPGPLAMAKSKFSKTEFCEFISIFGEFISIFGEFISIFGEFISMTSHDKPDRPQRQAKARGTGPTGQAWPVTLPDNPGHPWVPVGGFTIINAQTKALIPTSATNEQT